VAGYNSSELHDKKYITLDQMIAYNDWEINFSYDPIQNQSADVQYVHKLVNMSKEEVDKQRILPQGPEGAPEKPTVPEDKPKDPHEKDMPAAQNTEGTNGNTIRIDTDVMETFSGNVLKLEKYLNDSLTELGKINLAPGIFGAGTNLYGVYVGKGEAQGLHGNVQAFIKSLKETFFDLRADVDTMVSDFKTSEEIAEMTTEQLEAVFKESFGGITGLSKHVK